MKTLTLYAPEEFNARWPVFSAPSVIMEKRSHLCIDGYVVVGPGWVIRDYDPLAYRKEATEEELTRRIADLNACIAHIKAHPDPDESPALIRGGIPLDERRDREDGQRKGHWPPVKNPPPPPPAPPAPDTFRKGGVATVEYAVMLVLIAIAVLAFGTSISNAVTGIFSRLASGLGQ